MKLEYINEDTGEVVKPVNPNNEIGIMYGALYEFEFISIENGHMRGGEAWKIQGVRKFAIKVVEQ